MKLQTLAHLSRFKEIIAVFIKYGFADVIGLLDLPGQHLAERITHIDPAQTAYARFRMALDALGPTFVKFGQIMSLRSEMLPRPMTEELQKLQDHASAVDVEAIKSVVRHNLKTSWDEAFSAFEDTPLAAASLSQVHRAVLREGAVAVALKVQRPEIETTVFRDLSILESVAARMHQRLPEMRLYELPRLVNLIRRSLIHELDFSREARYFQLARSYLEDLEGIHIPRAFLNLSTPQLLVMEYVHGDHLRALDLDLLEDRAAIAKIGLRATVRQLFEVGFFHADPHPGNMLISEDRSLNLLDWGMVGRLTRRDRYEMVDLFTSIIEKDSARLVDTLLTITTGKSNIDRRALERDLLKLVDTHLIGTLSDLRLGHLVLGLMEIVREYRLRFPPDLLMMIKALVTAEGTVRQIHPEMDVVAEMRPYLARLAARRFDPENLWRGVRSLVFKLAASPSRFPKRITDIVEKMEKGKLRIGFEHQNLDELGKTLERTYSRLTMGVILGAMIIGSSLIITTGIAPIVFGYPLLGLAGYLVAAVLGMWLIVDILRNR